MPRKLSMPTGVRRAEPRPASGLPSPSPASSRIKVTAPTDGETLNLRITKAEGGHIVEEERHDRNYRSTTRATRVVTGTPEITVTTEK